MIIISKDALTEIKEALESCQIDYGREQHYDEEKVETSLIIVKALLGEDDKTNS